MTSSKVFAHSLADAPEDQWQLLEDHLRQVASLAAGFARPFCASDWAELAGRWHDLGKYSEAFQARLRGGPRVDHSPAGAKQAIEQLKGLAGKLLAYPIASHHAGLLDGLGAGKTSLQERLAKQLPLLNTVPSQILEPGAKLIMPLHMAPSTNRRRQAFQASFFIRMLFSCLVDGDFIDTEQFISPHLKRFRGPRVDLSQLLDRLNERLASFPQPESGTVNALRAEVLASCRTAASLTPGLFSLTVPTGGGKTLSSLAFGLEHARHHDLERIIYVIPYTSIIEQNARVFRQVLGEEAVLEHHSNYEHREEKNAIEAEEMSEGQEARQRGPSGSGYGELRHLLASQNWDAPVIVTTNVQFFESLFASRSSRCRRLHNISNSVVILDEAQMLPVQLLLPCLEALRELAQNYHCTIVLCTATQPALQEQQGFTNGLEKVHEIVEQPRRLHQAMQRVSFTFEPTPLDEGMLAAKLVLHQQVLCIVNSRKAALQTFEELSAIDPEAWHLSARMCPAHRSAVLEQIRAALSEGKKARVVSTQLVEAGVDIDFPVVFRAMAGLDSIVQAAGRCNREGRLHGLGNLTVFEPSSGIPQLFRRATEATRQVLRDHPADPFCLEAIQQYFAEVYWRAGTELDEKQILASLAEGKDSLDFPFAEIARRFRLIENAMRPVVIPWEEKAQALIEEARRQENPARTARRLQRYTVQVYERELEKLLTAGAIEQVGEFFCVLIRPQLYDANLGLQPDKQAAWAVEDLII